MKIGKMEWKSSFQIQEKVGGLQEDQSQTEWKK